MLVRKAEVLFALVVVVVVVVVVVGVTVVVVVVVVVVVIVSRLRSVSLPAKLRPFWTRVMDRPINDVTGWTLEILLSPV